MLTKSDFLLYLDSPLHLFAKLNHQITVENSQFNIHLQNQGKEVENAATEYIKKFVSKNFEAQRRFQTNNLECITDFTVENLKTKKFDIYEVKSSTDIKLDNEYDATFQYIVASKLIEIGKVYIIHLNKEYVREKELDLEKLFTVVDMTEMIQARLFEVEELIKSALQIPNIKNPHELEGCYKKKTCFCPQLCFSALPEYSIYNLSNIHKEKLIKMQEDGILDLNDIPDSYSLSHRQSIQVKSTKLKKVIYEKDRIDEFLSNLTYPLYFLDYESFSFAIPMYEKHGVYQDVVFQYSLHIQETPNDTLVHKEFLSVTKGDPISEVAKHITNDLKYSGSILVWNKQFEKGCNSEMGRIYPEYSERFGNINNRILDLSDIFSKQMYVDYRFKGSWSIKNVLPVLTPDLSYKKLNINNGTMAMLEWKDMVYKETDEKAKRKIYENLLEYCKMDTYAMFEILRFLQKI